MTLTADQHAAHVDALANGIESMDREILISLTPSQAACVIGQLQLAVRHPANKGVSSMVARSVAETLIGAFPPAARAALDLGWKQEFDRPVI